MCCDYIHLTLWARRSAADASSPSLDAGPPPELLLRLESASAGPGDSAGLSAPSLLPPFFFLAAEEQSSLLSSSSAPDGALAAFSEDEDSSGGEAALALGVAAGADALLVGVVSSLPLFLPLVGVSGFPFWATEKKHVSPLCQVR